MDRHGALGSRGRTSRFRPRARRRPSRSARRGSAIRAGAAPLALAGGAEAPLTLGTLKAWEALKTLATEDPVDPSASCKPFANDRSGLVLGEGAAVVVLEEWQHARRRGAQIFGELVGYGLATDSAHITRPIVDGQARALRARARVGARRARRRRLHQRARHGHAANDAVETAAIRRVFGAHAEQLPVSSTKSMHGHLLGAAGRRRARRDAARRCARGTLPPTMNLRVPDPECDLDYVPNAARASQDVELALTSSFAFGGTNAVLACRQRAVTCDANAARARRRNNAKADREIREPVRDEHRGRFRARPRRRAGGSSDR